MSKVSVIIPTYNRSKSVREAVESVLKQTYSNFEIIVVNDGSTDNTAEVVSKYKDSRIKHFYKQNGGLASARNFGISKAKGQYISFLDDDDLWPADYLEKMLAKLEENPQYGVGYSFMECVHPDGRITRSEVSRYHISGSLTERFYNVRPPCVVGGIAILRRRCLDGLWFDERLRDTDDLDFFLRLSCKTQFLCVPDAVLIRRITPDSMSAKALKNISPLEALILERFYYRLGGASFVPIHKARKGIARSYWRLAKRHYRAGNRKASIQLSRKAIGYWPFDWRYYKVLLRSYLLSRNKDQFPNWQPPAPLPTRIMVSRFDKSGQ